MTEYKRTKPFSESLEENERRIEKRKERNKEIENINEMDEKGNIIVLYEDDKKWDQTFDANNKILSKRSGDEYHIWDYDEDGNLLSQSYKLDPATKATTKKYTKSENNTLVEYFLGVKKLGSVLFNKDGQIVRWKNKTETILFNINNDGEIVQAKYIEDLQPLKKTTIEFSYPSSYKYELVELISSDEILEIHFIEKVSKLSGLHKSYTNDKNEMNKKFLEMKLMSNFSVITEDVTKSILRGERLKHETFFWDKKMVQIKNITPILEKLNNTNKLNHKYDPYKYEFNKDVF